MKRLRLEDLNEKLDEETASCPALDPSIATPTANPVQTADPGPINPSPATTAIPATAIPTTAIPATAIPATPILTTPIPVTPLPDAIQAIGAKSPTPSETIVASPKATPSRNVITIDTDSENEIDEGDDAFDNEEDPDQGFRDEPNAGQVETIDLT